MSITAATAITAKVGADVKGFLDGMSKVEKEINRIGATFTVTGARMSAAFTVPLAALGGFIVKTGGDFQAAMAGVRKTVDETSVNMDKLTMSIRTMAKEIPIAGTQLADFARIGAQLGVGQGGSIEKNTADLEKFTRTIAKLSIAAVELDPEAAARGLARLLALTHEDVGDNIEKVGSTLAFLADKLPTTEERILNFSVILSGVSSIAKLTAEEILGLSAGFSSVVPGTERASSAVVLLINKLTQALIEGGSDLKDFSDLTKRSGEDLQKTFAEGGLSSIIVDIVEGLARMNKESENSFKVLNDIGLGGAKATQTFQAGAGGVDLFRRAMNAATVDGDRFNKLNKETAVQTDIVNAKMTLLWAGLKDIGIQVFKDFEGIIRTVISTLQFFVNVLAEIAKFVGMLPLPIKAAIVTFAGLLAAIGPILFVLGGLISLGPAMSATLALIAAGFAKVGITVTASSGGLTLLLAKIAAVVAAFSVGFEIGKFLNESSALLQKLPDIVGKYADSIFKGRSETANFAVQQAALARATEIAREKTGNATITITGYVEAMRIIKEAAAEALLATTGFATAQEAAAAATTKTTTQLRASVAEYLKAKAANDRLAEAASFLGIKVEDVDEKLANIALATKKAREEAEAYQQKIKALVDGFNELTQEGKVAKFGDQLNALSQIRGELPLVEVRKLVDSWKDQNIALDRSISLVDHLITRIERYKQSLKTGLTNFLNNTTFNVGAPSSEDVFSGLPKDTGGPSSTEIKGSIDRLIEAGIGTGGIKTLAQIKKLQDKAKDSLKLYNKSLQQTNDLMQALGQFADTTMGKLIKGVMDARSGMLGIKAGIDQIKVGLVTKDFDDLFAGIVTGVQGAIQAFSALAKATESGGKAASAAKGAATGAQIGASTGSVYGLAIGAAIGAAIGFFRARGRQRAIEDISNELGVTIDEAMLKTIRDSGKNAQTFITEIFAKAFEEGTGDVNRFAEEIGDLFSFLERGEISEGDVLKELKEAIPLLIEHFGELGDEGQLQVQRIIESARAAGFSFKELSDLIILTLTDEALKNMGLAGETNVHKIQQAAAELGVEFDALFEKVQSTFAPSTMEQIAEAFGLTNDEVRAMAETLGIFIQTDLEKMAATVGLTADEFNALGAAMEQQLGVPAEQLLEFMEATGLSASELAEKLGVEVGDGAALVSEAQDLANQRIMTGVELAGKMADELERAARASNGISFPGSIGPDSVSAAGGFQSPMLPRDTTIFAHKGEAVSVGDPRSMGGGVSLSIGNITLGDVGNRDPAQIAREIGDALAIQVRQRGTTLHGAITEVSTGAS